MRRNGRDAPIPDLPALALKAALLRGWHANLSKSELAHTSQTKCWYHSSSQALE
jgi:hypothetical protein